VAADGRDSPEVTEGALVQPQEGLDLLVPGRLLIAVPGAAQGHAEDPRAPPLPGLGAEGGSALKEVDLCFFAWGAVIDAHHVGRPFQAPGVALDRLVAATEPELLDQVLPDPLQAQTGVELLDNRLVVGRGRGTRGKHRAGERFGRI